MKTDQTVIVRRSEYQAPEFLIDTVELLFDLDASNTQVEASLTVRRNGSSATSTPPLKLDGEQLQLLSVSIDGNLISNDQLRISDDSLEIPAGLLPADDRAFTLVTVSQLSPKANTSLSGLYASNGNLYTQCEAEGFRRITWFLDRPDVMSRYTVTLRGDQAVFPVLLSNGNLIESSPCPDRDGWHQARWEDPFAKPSYLFALVAGNLVVSERQVTTGSGKPRLLQIWVEPGNQNKTEHAMQALVDSIDWDEKRFGLELDLERFMIVAVSDFNMGAMENKGLNIFNTKYVFANPLIATDTDFANVESVVGHEYFHNWTGNRVTCRDWFQLTLKEGLTVFRDQEFSADMLAGQAADETAAISARAVKRIEDVRLLRTVQFAEDAGPMAHPIRPDSYAEINNFYTVTVYEKGAEVIRMLHTLVGEAGFRAGMDLYFERHDGQAVTCDDFIAALADANQRDFEQFKRWYSQAGTPILSVTDHYDAQSQQYTLELKQFCAPTPQQNDKQPNLIPVALALLGQDGKKQTLRLSDQPDGGPETTETVLELTEDAHRFVFTGLSSKPTPSILRGFSAPVILHFDYDDAALGFLAEHDDDPFNRWEAIQRLFVMAVLSTLGGTDPAAACASLTGVVAKVLADDQLDPAYKALALTVPGEGYIAEQLSQVDPVAIRAARNAVSSHLALTLEQVFVECFEASSRPEPYQPDAASAGLRSLKNLALSYLVQTGEGLFASLAAEKAQNADNMTDRSAGLIALLNSASPDREAMLEWFADQYQDEPLAMDKWFAMQATAHRQPGEPPVLTRVTELRQHPAYSNRNPNRVRSLISAFCGGNLAEFHALDGSGYRFWRDQILELDPINPQVASRLARVMDRWRKFDPARQQMMKNTLTELAEGPPLSRDVTEIISKTLAD